MSIGVHPGQNGVRFDVHSCPSWLSRHGTTPSWSPSLGPYWPTTDTRTSTDHWQFTSAVSLISNRQLDAPRLARRYRELPCHPGLCRPAQELEDSLSVRHQEGQERDQQRIDQVHDPHDVQGGVATALDAVVVVP
jgi:hypothetical protein